jgi:lipopolysaccharide/colanic/teichoic acid biosynthesis glycosyltransferase
MINGNTDLDKFYRRNHKNLFVTVVKRSFDIIASFLGLLTVSPVILVIYALIKIRMPGPALFRQKRTGKDGKLFTMIKFRTMVLNDGNNTTSVRGDKRITPLGSVLRKYKLDELPELWNVLKGDMSLVGPRPDVPEFTRRLTGEEKLILSLRPGITGPATIKYSDEEELLAGVADPKQFTDEVIWPDKVKINLDYYYNRSFLKDLQIIIGTLFRKSSVRS